MLGAAIRLNQQGLFKRQILGNSVEHRRLRVAHILRHAAVIILLEAEGGMGLTHPVAPGFAEFALAARHNLIRRDSLAQLVSLHVLSHFHNASQELMSRNEGRLYPGRILLITPEALRAVLTFQVSRTDSADLRLDNNIVVSALRYREIIYQLILILAESHQSLHRFW